MEQGEMEVAIFWPKVQRACRQLLQGDIEQLSQAGQQTLHLGDLVGQISLKGTENWSVWFSWSRRAAETAVAKIFLVPVDDLTSEDLFDVTGEITNLIAGQLQAQLLDGMEISLPVVICENTDSDHDTDYFEGGLVNSASFSWSGEVFQVNILRRHHS